jgi:hypothetical protein
MEPHGTLHKDRKNPTPAAQSQLLPMQVSICRVVPHFVPLARGGCAGLPDVWWATREEIADFYLANHESHFPDQL